VEEIAGGQHVVQGPVGRLVGEPEAGGQGAELAVGHLVPDQPARQRQRVHLEVGRGLAAGRHQCVVEEGDIEAKVVADQHGPADELEQGGEHLPDPGGVGHHGVADAGEGGDERRDPHVGTDEGPVGAEQFAAPVAGRGHLGEGAGGR